MKRKESCRRVISMLVMLVLIFTMVLSDSTNVYAQPVQKITIRFKSLGKNPTFKYSTSGCEFEKKSTGEGKIDQAGDSIRYYFEFSKSQNRDWDEFYEDENLIITGDNTDIKNQLKEDYERYVSNLSTEIRAEDNILVVSFDYQYVAQLKKPKDFRINDDNEIRWSKSSHVEDGESFFRVKLYRNGTHKETYEVEESYFELPNMRKGDRFYIDVWEVPIDEHDDEYLIKSDKGTSPTYRYSDDGDYNEEESCNTNSGGPGTGNWIRRNDGKWKYTNGNWYATGWKLINNRWYLFNADGIMLTGWQLNNGEWYYLETQGAVEGSMFEEWHNIGGRWFYFEPSSGRALFGYLCINGVYYYIDYNNGLE